RQPPSVGRESEITVCLQRLKQMLSLAIATQPIDGNSAPAHAPQINERATIRKSKLRCTNARIAHHTLNRLHRLALQLQFVGIEPYGKQRSLVHVEQMSAPYIARIISAALHNLRFPASERMHHDIRVFKVVIYGG